MQLTPRSKSESRCPLWRQSISFLVSSAFLVGVLFCEQDASKALKRSQFFKLHSAPLFFQFVTEECHKSFDSSTSLGVWQLGFFTLDMLQLIVMLIALLWGFCSCFTYYNLAKYKAASTRRKRLAIDTHTQKQTSHSTKTKMWWKTSSPFE